MVSHGWRGRENVENVNRSQMLGFVDYGKKFETYSKSNEKPMNSFLQRADLGSIL